MSIIRSTQYPNRWNPPSADAPQGSGKNRTSPTSNDGSYFDQVWFNDMDSLHQALFIASGVSPDGSQDIGTESQIFDALVNNRWSAIGNYSPGTIVTASDGNQYYCKSPNGRDSAVVDPTSVSDRSTWVRYPYEEGFNSNGDYRIYFDDSIDQWGQFQTDASGLQSVTFPIPFLGSASNVRMTITDSSADVTPNAISCFAYGNVTLTGFDAASIKISTGAGSPDVCTYHAHSRG